MFCLYILVSNVKNHVPGKTKDINVITQETDHRYGGGHMTAEYQSSALVIILLVVGAIQMSRIDKVVLSHKISNLFWKRVSSLLYPPVSSMLCVFLSMLALKRPLPWKKMIKFLLTVRSSIWAIDYYQRKSHTRTGHHP